MKNHKAIGFLSNTGPDPMKNHKATKPNSILGHLRPTREMPFTWHFPGGPMMARFEWYLDPLSSHQLKKQQQKNFRAGPPLTKLSGSAHDVISNHIINRYPA